MNNLIDELRYLIHNQTEIEKQIKKVVFLFITIIFPLYEFIFLILQEISFFYNFQSQTNSNNNDINFLMALSLVLCLFSLMCTWSMMGVCYDKSKCVFRILFVKSLLIGFMLLIAYQTKYFYYYLVFNILGYGLFFTLIMVYKSFKSGFI